MQAQTLLSSDCLAAAHRLYDFLQSNHTRDDGALVGPDSGARWHRLIWRFVKSYLPARDWGDGGKYLLHAQGYWILDNLALFRASGDETYLRRAVQCADIIISRQTEMGCWILDSKEWKDRIASVEGCFASIGLLAAHRATGDPKYLDSAKRWWHFMINETGFQDYDSESKALNYWAYRESPMVPNNATLGLWFAAEMADVTGDQCYLEICPPMINFLRKCQLPTGEFPYALYPDTSRNRIHFLCYQYHAFQFIDMAEYYRLTKDETALPLIEGLAKFLKGGVGKNGECRHDCSHSRPGVIYYTAAIAAALRIADDMGLGDYKELSDRAYKRVIRHQKSDGGFIFSYGDYLILSDKRSYPRNEAMILYHLLIRTAE